MKNMVQVMKESGILEAEVKLETEPESIHTEHLKVYTIISYLFGSLEVNLSCKNSHYYKV